MANLDDIRSPQISARGHRLYPVRVAAEPTQLRDRLLVGIPVRGGRLLPGRMPPVLGIDETRISPGNLRIRNDWIHRRQSCVALKAAGIYVAKGVLGLSR
jgi:hypothetical protein